MGEIFERVEPASALEWTGERLTTGTTGQVEIEHLHRYILAREFCRGLDVLDVASGEGYGTALLAQVAASAVGVEISPQAAQHAAANYRMPGLRYVEGDARSLPLDHASVDIVVSFETIEHLYEHDAFLSEVKRVLRPGGRLIISSPERDVYSPLGSPANPYHVRELSRGEFEEALRRFFTHIHLLSQRPMIGSALVSASGGATGRLTFERRGANRFEASNGLPRAVYLVAIASDAELAAVPDSLFIETGEIGAIMNQARIAEALLSEVDTMRTRAEAAEAAAADVRAELACCMEQAKKQAMDYAEQLRLADHKLQTVKEELHAQRKEVDAAQAGVRAARLEVQTACAQRDVARVALRRAAVFAENAWRTRVTDAERRVKEMKRSRRIWILRWVRKWVKRSKRMLWGKRR